MIHIKTLADFKREIKQGVKLETIYHLGKFIGRDEYDEPVYLPTTIPPREVKTVKSTMFSFLTQKPDGTTSESWLNYPAARDFEANGTNEVKIYDFDERKNKKTLLLTYKFV